MSGPRRRWACVGPAAVAVGLLAAAMAVAVGSAEPVAAAGPSWVRTGGPLGGLGYDVRMRPDDPDRLLVTDAYAGVHVSDDAGRTWHPSNEGITTRTGSTGDSIPVFCLTVDPHDPDIVWAGTQNLRGLFKSVDGGETWMEKDEGVEEDEGITFRGITIDPRSSEIVYAAGEVSSWTWAGEERPGREFDLTKGVVYKSVDGGERWSAVWRGDNLARYIWIDPDDPEVVYVSTGIFDREAANSDPTDAAKSQPGGEGVIKSTDGGQTWQNVNTGLGNLYVGTLFMHPADPQILLAGTGNNQYYQGDGVYLSLDGAASWQRTLRDDIITSVEFSTADPQVAYAASADRVYLSEDGGHTWRSQTRQSGWGPPGVRAGFPIDLQVDPRDPARVFANNYGGGNFVSGDAGRTWTVASTGYTGAQVRDVAVVLGSPGWVFAAARSGVFASFDGGGSWSGSSNQPASLLEWNAVATDPADPAHVLAANNWQPAVMESRDGGLSWVARSLRLGAGQGWRALAFAPSDPRVAYAGTGAYRSAGSWSTQLPARGIYVSRDGGRTWREADDATSDLVQVTALAVDPADPARVFAAAGPAGLLRTDDGGDSWQVVRGGLPVGATLTAVAIDPRDPAVMLAGTARAGVYRSVDGGQTWGDVVAGLNPEAAVSDLVFDPADRGFVFLADALSGVYRSTDGGMRWEVLNQGLTTRAVNALAISDDGSHVYAATEGGGVFRWDDDDVPPRAAVPPRTFIDIPRDSWYALAVQGLYARAVVAGYAGPGGTEFRPENPVWRAQFAKMIVGALQLPVEEDMGSPFTDLGPDVTSPSPGVDNLYPHEYVAAAAQAGLTTGVTPATFAPYRDISRAQVMTMIVRALREYGQRPVEEPPDGYPGWGDLAYLTDPTHGPNAHVAECNGVLEGIDLRGWDVWMPATRGEVAQMLWNAVTAFYIVG